MPYGRLAGRYFRTGDVAFLGGSNHIGDVEAVAAQDSPVHRLDPQVKIIGLIGLVVVSVSLPVGSWLAFGAVLAILSGLVVAARLSFRHVVDRMTIEVPFLLAAAVLPFTIEDGVRLGAAVGLKITAGMLAMVILSSTTPFPRLLRGFELLRTPRLMVVIVAFMWRYLHVLGDEVLHMRTARAARGYSAGRLPQAIASTGTLISTLFVRSLERGERVYLAMLSRGYSGSMPATATNSLALRTTDLWFLAALVALLALVRLLLA